MGISKPLCRFIIRVHYYGGARQSNIHPLLFLRVLLRDDLRKTSEKIQLGFRHNGYEHFNVARQFYKLVGFELVDARPVVR